MRIAIKYAIFATISIIVNVCTQSVALLVYTGRFNIILSVLVGTGTGLVTKYTLDKLFIFRYRTSGLSEDFSKFISYTLTGVFTTLLFWGFQFGFITLFGSTKAGLVGAVIGLSIGYVIKYQLDNRYVFRKGVV